LTSLSLSPQFAGRKKKKKSKMAYKDAVAGVQPYPQPISALPTTIASTGSNLQIRIHASSFLIY